MIESHTPLRVQILLPSNYKQRSLPQGQAHAKPVDHENMWRIAWLYCRAKALDFSSFESAGYEGMDKVDLVSAKHQMFFEPRRRDFSASNRLVCGEGQGLFISLQKVDALRFRARAKGYRGVYCHGLHDAIFATEVSHAKWWDWATTRAWAVEGGSYETKRNGGKETMIKVRVRSSSIPAVCTEPHPLATLTPWGGKDDCFYPEWKDLDF